METKIEKLLKIIEKFKRDGWTFQKIGEKVGFSRQYIHQVWSKEMLSGGKIVIENWGEDLENIKNVENVENVEIKMGQETKCAACLNPIKNYSQKYHDIHGRYCERCCANAQKQAILRQRFARMGII